MRPCVDRYYKVIYRWGGRYYKVIYRWGHVLPATIRDLCLVASAIAIIPFSFSFSTSFFSPCLIFF